MLTAGGVRRFTVRLITDDQHYGNLTVFPGGKAKRDSSEDDRSCDSEEMALKTLEEPFESAGRSRRIARLRERVLSGAYHVSSIELADRMITGDLF
jgi:anti-sigma28 factor (negative regulator of flagellin synthesis)